jgi:hypothetical protein
VTADQNFRGAISQIFDSVRDCELPTAELECQKFGECDIGQGANLLKYFSIDIAIPDRAVDISIRKFFQKFGDCSEREVAGVDDFRDSPIL